MNDRESEDIETFGYYGENFSELRVFIKKAIHIKPIVSLMRNLALSSYEHFDGGGTSPFELFYHRQRRFVQQIKVRNDREFFSYFSYICFRKNAGEGSRDSEQAFFHHSKHISKYGILK